MASIRQETGRNGFRLSFYGPDKRKRSIWLGDFSKRQAEAVKGHVEYLLAAKAAGVAPELQTATWLGTIGPELRGKLATAGLIEKTAEDRGPVTLKAFLDEYVAHRRDVKPTTHLQYRTAMRSLLGFFGAEARLDSIDAVAAERWRIHCRSIGWADNTLRRATGRAKQFFQHAVKLKAITENPFEGFAVAVHGNSKRQHFVRREDITKAVEACPCPELRAVIALSRYAGVRTPSETVRLTWQDVDFEAGRLTIHAPKTEHHEDGGVRFCPLFPELRPFLQELHDRANPGIDCPMSSPVITRWRSGDQNLRTAFLKLLTKAGVKAWPKLFHNMRASRQTELLAQFPAADVCDWLGNTQAVAMKHYAMATSDSFEQAVRGTTVSDCGSTGGSISANLGLSGDGPEMQKPPKPKGFEGFSELPIGAGVPRLGLEPRTY
jgi:integrase